ncbi:type II toxin-antitoxin system Phd/YefM family antitoxin [Occultella glacieicola]|uniref:Antitoxin n=1 Tax=Occultella glacieicola TaxID=2518684 RepID=A0ABY2DZN0_9MICO|nr:type II toxin-antitoxin system prevent-host-death family antitoxin [Occultella glacieicola]TDE89606.1 type II toxin-antitoxin system Phd/YefM family antitoxin [Occultella glacieicola]
MGAQVNVQEAKTRLSELLKRVEAGESITIARAGRPVAELRPAQPVAPVFGGLVPGLVVGPEFFEELPEDELSRWDGTP